jgi:hypothetical protein
LFFQGNPTLMSTIPLTGPAHLIDQAESTRRQWLYHCGRSFTKAYGPEEADKAMDIMLTIVNQVPDAAWWIENKDVLRDAFAPVWKAEWEKMETSSCP